METATTTPIKTGRQSLTRIKDDILIYVANDTYLKFTKVFQFPGDGHAFIGHINIWDDNAPFYILFDRVCLRKLSIKGYNKCLFIPNSFVIGHDKNNKLYLRSIPEYGNVYLKYFPITSMKDLRDLVTYKNKGHKLYPGFSKQNKLSVKGEAIEIVQCSR
jgi:hypothetical protein